MNMLKFGYGIVLDGLPDIPEFHFFSGVWTPQTQFSSNVVYIFQKSLNVWKDICLEAHHVGAHLMEAFGGREKQIKSFWMFTVPDSLLCQILFYCFVCLCIMCFLFILLPPLCPYYVCSNLIMKIFSVDGHHLAI